MANKKAAAPAPAGPRDPLIRTRSENAAASPADQEDFKRRGGTVIEDAALPKNAAPPDPADEENKSDEEKKPD